MIQLNKEFWTSRYLSGHLGWDAGEITTPLKSYIDQITNKELKILIPGCGNGYEAEYLHKSGFKVDVVDLSGIPLKGLAKRCPGIPESCLIQGDFFDLKGRYDLIIEQTFFCAINPGQRSRYARKMHSLLNLGGKLIGVLFNIPLYNDRPPFGGSKQEYIGYFDQYFEFKSFDECYNSIQPRKGMNYS